MTTNKTKTGLSKALDALIAALQHHKFLFGKKTIEKPENNQTN